MTYMDEFMAVFQKKRRLNRWARQTGFRKRKGKLSPFDFVVLMTMGQLGMKHPSLAGMVTAIDARISRVALHYRFSEAAAAFLLKCLQFVLQQKFSCIGVIDTKLLRPFRRVLLVDSSSWNVSESLCAMSCPVQVRRHPPPTVSYRRYTITSVTNWNSWMLLPEWFLTTAIPITCPTFYRKTTCFPIVV